MTWGSANQCDKPVSGVSSVGYVSRGGTGDARGGPRPSKRRYARRVYVIK